ncbi:MAG TPA: diaminopimelate decarboxylase [Thermomicrobiales bacterium]|jgi:diaminopimelate decarboxylase|nr:diaminopimelate decarboxylase [Thermomicrobiales bacterium]
MLWPDTFHRDDQGVMQLGGVSLPDLAADFGTPLYVYDEATLRSQARRVREAFAAVYPDSRVVYAGKALLSPGIVAVLHDERLGLDVVSGGELYAGLAAGVPASEITFHGNNKSVAELQEAVEAGVGLVIVDNLGEIDLLSSVATNAGKNVDCLLRLNPGIDTHTHDKIRTGHLDSKFGLPISTGDAERAVAAMQAAPGLRLRGYHAHIGSQLFEPDAYAMAVDALLGFGAAMRGKYGVELEIVSPGGGFGIAYEPDQVAATVEDWAAEVARTIREACARHGLAEPALVVEPGRSMVGRAGVAVYSAGETKVIPGVRTFLSVDGGMADNIRPTLYGARYHIELAGRPMPGDGLSPVTVAGKYCESGDILIEGAMLPPVERGELLAVPAAGAYCMAMASNYNMATRPAIVLVNGGLARLVRRRETYADLLSAEILPPARVPSSIS